MEGHRTLFGRQTISINILGLNLSAWENPHRYICERIKSKKWEYERILISYPNRIIEVIEVDITTHVAC